MPGFQNYLGTTKDSAASYLVTPGGTVKNPASPRWPSATSPGWAKPQPYPANPAPAPAQPKPFQGYVASRQTPSSPATTPTQPNTGAGTYNYYDPTRDYGSRQWGWGKDYWNQTPLGDIYLEKNHQAAFTRYLADNGYRDFTGEGEFARQQFGKLDTGYESALATNPNLKFREYLQQVGGNLRNQYARMTPEQRGENQSIFAPRARYIPR